MKYGVYHDLYEGFLAHTNPARWDWNESIAICYGSELEARKIARRYDGAVAVRFYIEDGETVWEELKEDPKPSRIPGDWYIAAAEKHSGEVRYLVSLKGNLAEFSNCIDLAKFYKLEINARKALAKLPLDKYVVMRLSGEVVELKAFKSAPVYLVD